MDNAKISENLLKISNILERVRFASFDQNPSGVRDLVYSASRDFARDDAEGGIRTARFGLKVLSKQTFRGDPDPDGIKALIQDTQKMIG